MREKWLRGHLKPKGQGDFQFSKAGQGATPFGSLTLHMTHCIHFSMNVRKKNFVS